MRVKLIPQEQVFGFQVSMYIFVGVQLLQLCDELFGNFFHAEDVNFFILFDNRSEIGAETIHDYVFANRHRIFCDLAKPFGVTEFFKNIRFFTERWVILILGFLEN